MRIYNEINCNGMYRSGSTLIYIICKKIFEYENIKGSVFKKHESLAIGLLNIYTYRDIRDVLVSLIHKDGFTLDSFNIHGLNIIDFTKKLIRFDKFIENNPRVLRIKYEGCVLDQEEKLVNFLYKIIGAPNTHSNRIIEEVKMGNLKKIVRDPDYKFEESTQLHKNHIKDGKIGKWEDYFKDNELEGLYKATELRSWLKKRDIKFNTQLKN